jgi:hypothetical protein
MNHRHMAVLVLAGLGAVGASTGVACSNGPSTPDGGDAIAPDVSATGCIDAGLTGLQSFTPPPDPGAGKIWVTASGEVNALTGYPFPPNNWSNDTYMEDGWLFVIHEYIVIVDKVTLWSDPNLSPTDQSQHGPPVAHIDGPFVVDLHKGGTIIGQGGAPEEATPIGVFTNQNDNGGAAFDPTTTYGFGFSTVPATCAAVNVNLSPDEGADFDLMVQNGYSVLYVGQATWMGDNSGWNPTCTYTTLSGSDAGTDGGTGGYDFTQMPLTMSFKLGFSTPTDYVNCQNMTLQGTPLMGEDYPRGIQVSGSQSVFAQVTVHMDHPFWESFAENSPVHWDQIAAQYIGYDGGVPTATVEGLMGEGVCPITDKNKNPIPWRSCAGMYYMPPGNGAMCFSTLSVPLNPNETDPTKAIRDYYDYVRYSQSTQGHLNSQGLCFIDRQFPSPPGGS